MREVYRLQYLLHEYCSWGVGAEKEEDVSEKLNHTENWKSFNSYHEIHAVVTCNYTRLKWSLASFTTNPISKHPENAALT